VNASTINTCFVFRKQNCTNFVTYSKQLVTKSQAHHEFATKSGIQVVFLVQVYAGETSSTFLPIDLMIA